MTLESVGVLKTSLVLASIRGTPSASVQRTRLPTTDDMSGLESFKVLADRKKTIDNRESSAFMESALPSEPTRRR